MTYGRGTVKAVLNLDERAEFNSGFHVLCWPYSLAVPKKPVPQQDGAVL